MLGSTKPKLIIGPPGCTMSSDMQNISDGQIELKQAAEDAKVEAASMKATLARLEAMIARPPAVVRKRGPDNDADDSARCDVDGEHDELPDAKKLETGRVAA